MSRGPSARARDGFERGERSTGGREDDGPCVRITNQFRKRDAMVYDLSYDEVRLTLEFSAGDEADRIEDWRVEGFARQAPERPTLREGGRTRRDALLALARAWSGKQGLYGFPKIDWDGVADSLLAVRAI